MRYLWILLLLPGSVFTLRADLSGSQVNKDVEAPVERRFLQRGSYRVCTVKYPVTDDGFKAFTVCVPEEITEKQKRFPVIVYCNGTGVPVSRSLWLMEHLASWGFIAVGNEENMSGSGGGAIAMLNFLLQQNELPESIFYQKIDISNIGIAGHSQGGAGAFNAATRYRESCLFKALFAVSPINQKLAASAVMRCAYDPAGLKLPVMLTASSALDGWDADTLLPGICSLRSMQSIWRQIRQNPGSTVVSARLAGRDKNHANALVAALPYMTAWFAYFLQNDQAAGTFFAGDNPELENNPRWRDTAIKMP